MAYKALYREWRPDVFEEVVGQEHITSTLKNQIKNNKIAHAYLFSGIRGTGKTSTAKIFARAINCLNPNDNDPCNECEICKGILKESIMDVVEIDAASNNGVDNIREIRENVKYPPSKANYKVYIIDEVHMLSQGAFNALLKTLEEPPEYVVFILATTEPQKIPATILSRCQRFDFKRVTKDNIVKRLKFICNKLDIDIEDKAVELIVQSSDGAVRDALSRMDQCISFSGENITYEDVLNSLGLVNDTYMFDIVNSIIEEDFTSTLVFVNEILNDGKDVGQFIKDLIKHYRNIMIAKVSNDPSKVIDSNEDKLEKLLNQSQKLDTNNIIRHLNILSKAESDIKWASSPRIDLELALVKLLNPEYDDSKEALVKRIESLETEIKLLTSGKIQIATSNQNITPAKTNTLAQTHTTSNRPSTMESSDKVSTIKETAGETITKPIDKNEDVVTSDISFPIIRDNWSNILADIKKRKITIHAFLLEGKPIGTQNNFLLITFNDGFGFHKDATNKRENAEIIESSILKVTNQKVKIKCIMIDEASDVRVDKVVEVTNEDKVKKYFDNHNTKLEIVD